MKAIVYQRFGSPDILECQEVEKPVPGHDEVLIKVRAASINPLDWKLMKGGPFIMRLLVGLGKPKLKRPGVDVAGEVEAVGKNVTQFKPGVARLCVHCPNHAAGPRRSFYEMEVADNPPSESDNAYTCLIESGNPLTG